MPDIIPYRGFGSETKFSVIGRVTEHFAEFDEAKARKRDNILLMLRRYIASPMPNTQVEVRLGGTSVVTVTNENGFFNAVFSVSDHEAPSVSEWHAAEACLIENGVSTTCVPAEVLVEGQGNTFGIISDIDDTILISDATKKLRLLYRTFSQNALLRKPFPGVGEFYQALIKGPTGTNTNPIFYVSSSHSNIYEFLERFIDINHLPKGPILLKETRSVWNALRTVGNHTHKKEKIEEILGTYPALPFILIGDSGQQDARIYSEIALAHPGRIKTIYIRDVTVKDDEIVTEALKALGTVTELVVIKTTKEAADHALAKGFIVHAQKEEVRTHAKKEAEMPESTL